MSDGGHTPRALFVVLGAVALTFAVTVTFPFMGWDDPRYVMNNPLVIHPLGHGLRALLTTPSLGYPQSVTVLSYAANFAAFGMSPWSFHLVNVALHLLNVVLVWRVACSVGLGTQSSCLAAMVFGLHPLVVEPVSWVTGRKDLLAVTLVLSAIAVVLLGGPDAAFPRRPRWLIASLLVLLGIGAKPSVAIAPALVWIVASAARPDWPRRKLAAALAPLALVATTLLLVEGRSVVDVHPRSTGETFLDALGAWTLQAGHLVWPVDLVTSYARLENDPSRLAMAVGVCGLVAVVFAFAKAPRSSPGFTGLAFAAVAYAPVSGVLAVNRWCSDSYMYLSLVGLAIAGAAGLRAALSDRFLRVRGLGAAALGLTLMVDSFAHASNWSSPEGPWLAAIQRYPGNPVPYNELASTLAWEGKHAEAVRAYEVFDQRFPDFEFARAERASALVDAGHSDRAKALLSSGIAAGDDACARTFWLLLLQGGISISRADQATVAASFTRVSDQMHAQIHDPSVWLKISRLLADTGLDGLGRAAEATAASLPP